jgi:hypothetical protein
MFFTLQIAFINFVWVRIHVETNWSTRLFTVNA